MALDTTALVNAMVSAGEHLGEDLDLALQIVLEVAILVLAVTDAIPAMLRPGFQLRLGGEDAGDGPGSAHQQSRYPKHEAHWSADDGCVRAKSGHFHRGSGRHHRAADRDPAVCDGP